MFYRKPEYRDPTLKTWLVLIVAAVLIVFGLNAAVAQTQSPPQVLCDDRDSVLAVLAEKYKESPVALGVTHNGSLIEVLTTGNGNTWSIIVTTPQGMSCLVAAGEGWKAMQALALDPEA